MPLYIAHNGYLVRCYRCLTDSLTTLKDRATQPLIKYKSGALVTQLRKEVSPLKGQMFIKIVLRFIRFSKAKVYGYGLNFCN